MYKFYFRTAFTKEVFTSESTNYKVAKHEYEQHVLQRLPIRAYLDYVWKCDSDGNAVERVAI